MKNASVILSHLVNQPQFRYLKQQVCYKKFIALLGAKWQKAIAFVYIKEKTLFVAVTHPGFKMELNYNRDLLKSVLTDLASHDSECASLQADNVIVFHSRYRSLIDEKKQESTVPYYHEQASSNFKIACKDETLAERFQKTKELIACNRS